MTDLTGDPDLAEMILRGNGRFISPAERERYLALLTRFASHPDHHVREAVGYRVGWLLPDDDGRAEALIRTLIDDSEDLVRFAAGQATLRRGSAAFQDELAARIVPTLLTAVHGKRGVERARLISSLGDFPSHAATVLPTLIEALDSMDPRERYCASRSLGRFAGAAHSAADPLRRAIARETEYWISAEGTMDLRRIHAETLFRVIGDNPWSRAMLSERLAMTDLPANIRDGALHLQRQLNGLEPIRGT